MSSKNSPALGYAINRAVKWIWNEFKEQPALAYPINRAVWRGERCISGKQWAIGNQKKPGKSCSNMDIACELKEQPGLRIQYKSISKMGVG